MTWTMHALTAYIGTARASSKLHYSNRCMMGICNEHTQFISTEYLGIQGLQNCINA